MDSTMSNSNQQTSSSTISEKERNGIEKEENLVEAALFLIGGVFIITINAYVISIIYLNAYLHTRANTYIVSLASKDLLIGILSLFTGFYFLPPTGKTFDENIFLCLGFITMGYFSIICTILNTCLIAVDRYHCVFNSFQYLRLATDKRIKIAIVSVWGAAFLVGTCPVLFHEFHQSKKCILDEVIPEFFHKYVYSGFFLTGSLFTAAVYGKMGYFSYREIERITKSKRRPTLVFDLKSFSETIKLFAWIFCCFFICWLPYIVVGLIPNVPALLVQAFLGLGYLNSAVNGFIYGYFDKQFRLASIKLLFPKTATSSFIRKYSPGKPPVHLNRRISAMSNFSPSSVSFFSGDSYRSATTIETLQLSDRVALPADTGTSDPSVPAIANPLALPKVDNLPEAAFQSVRSIPSTNVDTILEVVQPPQSKPSI